MRAHGTQLARRAAAFTLAFCLTLCGLPSSVHAAVEWMRELHLGSGMTYGYVVPLRPGDHVVLQYHLTIGRSGPSPTEMIVWTGSGRRDQLGPGRLDGGMDYSSGAPSEAVRGAIHNWDADDSGVLRIGRELHPEEIPKPNIAVVAVERSRPGGCIVRYLVTGALPRASELAIEWVLQDGGRQAILQAAIDPVLGAHAVAVSKIDLYGAYAPGAAAIRAVADPRNAIDESSESDNAAVLPLPNYALKSISRDEAGNCQVVAVVAGGRTPYNINPRVRLGWFVPCGRVGDPITMQLACGGRKNIAWALPKEAGEYTWTLPLAKVPDSEAADLGTRIYAALDLPGAQFGESVESNEDDNFGSLDVAEISFELQHAPLAGSSLERVALWVRLQRSTILRAAQRFNVEPRAIVGAIAWEATQNRKPRAASNGFGPGKVHRGTAQQVEQLGWVRSHDDVARAKLLRTPAGAINYIAAILNAYAVEAEQASPEFYFRNSPAILATYYNGSFASDLKQCIQSGYFPRMRDSGGRPNEPNATMGTWIRDHARELGEMLGEPYYRPRRGVTPRRVHARIPW